MTPPPRWQDLLQDFLDEKSLEVPAPPSERDRVAVERLLLGLDRLAPPAPPADLAARITASLCREVRDRRRRKIAPLVGLAAAASLLLVLGMRLAWPVGDDSAPRASNAPITRAEPFRDSIGRAGTALATLTTQTAGTTVEHTSSVFPLINPQALQPMPPMPPLEAPLEPFREASTGVSTGLGPVTDSAQRAVRLFMRDLPVVRSTPHKPG